MKKLLILSTLMLIASLLITSIFFYKIIIIPAKISLIGDCNDCTIQNYGDKTYEMVGSFTVVNNTPVINNYGTTPEQKTNINIHESCHQKQWEENRLGDCQHKFKLLINEIEAYLAAALNSKC